MTTSYHDSTVVFNELAPRLVGQLVLPDNVAYDQARQLWNGRVQIRPAAIVRCANTEDVAETLRWARTHGLPVSVRGAGHEIFGRSLREQGIAIDLSQLRAVTIIPTQRVAHIQAGATASDLIAAAEHYGLATTTGTVSSVGMAGLTLGGGYGPLMGAYGLAADNLTAAEIVTADGKLVAANDEEHTDLLWALRGGSGNFGVVVSLEYRLHPLTTVLAGMLMYPLEQASAVLRQFNEFIASAPDALTIRSGFLQTPDGATMLFLSPTYAGPLDAGEQAIAPLRSFGTPLVDQIGPITYNELIRSNDAYTPPGRHYYLQTRSLARLQPEAIAALIQQGLPLPSPFSTINIHHFHGAASRVGVSGTAFALRQDHLMIELIAAWEPGSPDAAQRHIAWAQHSSRALAPYALPGGYVNLLDEAEQARVPLAYGPNYGRLREIKRRYDPHDVFDSTVGHIR